MKQKDHKPIIDQKMAIERLMRSADGELLIKYLGEICLKNIGAPCTNAYEYAYNEGRRSVFLALLQMAEKNLSMFVYNLVKDEENNF